MEKFVDVGEEEIDTANTDGEQPKCKKPKLSALGCLLGPEASSSVLSLSQEHKVNLPPTNPLPCNVI